MITVPDNPPAIYAPAEGFHAWNIPSVNISAFSSPEIVYEKLPFSVLNPETTFYSFAQAADLVDATGKPIQEVQAYTPERMLLQEAIIRVASGVQLRNDKGSSYEESIQHTVSTLLADIPKEKIQSYSAEMNRFYEETEARMLSAARHEAALDGADQKAFEQASTELAAAEARRGKPIVFSPAETRESTLARRATQLRYNEAGREAALGMIEEALAERFHDNSLKPITLHEREDARVYMINGGQASGKGYNVIGLEQEMGEESSLERTDRIYINGDAFKPLLEGPEHSGDIKYVKAQLLHNESSLIKGRIMAQLASAEKIPNILIDQVYPGPDTLALGTSVREPMKINIMTNDVEQAMGLSFNRGKKTGRYEERRIVLVAHRNVSVQLIDRMLENAGKNISLEIYDSNILEKPPVLIMKSNLQDATIDVIDPIATSRFFDKAAINVEAQSISEVYNPRPDPSLGFLERLTKKFKNVTVSLPDPSGIPKAALKLRPEDGKFITDDSDSLRTALEQNPKLIELLNSPASQALLDESVNVVVAEAAGGMSSPGSKIAGDSKKNLGPLVDPPSQDRKVGG